MNRILRSFFDIRKGEYTLALLMVFYYYFILVTYYFLKPARDSLFLVKLGASQLPLVFILIAIVVVPITTIYSKASRSLRLNQLLAWTTIVLILNLIILRWLLTLEQGWIFYLFYIWVSLYGALTTSQFWLFANAIFDAGQAKRIFALIGLGGILGATTGGEVTSLIIRNFNVKTENLLFICMGVLSLTLVLLNVIWAVKRREGEPRKAPVRKSRYGEEKRKESFADMFRMVRRSRHLVFIVGIIATAMMTASFVDFQFKAISVDAFPAKEDLTSFLGKFYGRLSIVSLLLQFLFTNRFIRLLGVGGAIFFLPGGLLFGSIMVFLYPGLLSGVLLRGTDGSFRYSIDKTGRELLFLPVPLEIKKRTKLFIDMFVDRWFRGLAGAFLLLFTLVLHLSVRQISIVVFVLLGVWMTLALFIRKEYVNAFRSALEKRAINLDELRINPEESNTLKTLIAALQSDNDRQVAYALNMLSSVRDRDLVSAVKPLLKHASTEVRIKAIQVLHNQENGDLVPEMEPLLKDKDSEVRLRTMQFLCYNSPDGAVEVLDRYLKDSDPLVQAAAVVCAAECDGFDEDRLAETGAVESLIAREGKEGEACRIQAAKALASVRSPALRKLLLELLDDSSPAVVKQAIESIGKTQDRDLVPSLLVKLSDSRYRADARGALAAYGDRILGTLSDHFRDDRVSLAVRRSVPRVMREIPTQLAVDTLTINLDVTHPQLKYHVVRALSSLRSKFPDLRFKEDKVLEALIEETKSYYEILQILHVHRKTDDDPASRLLGKALEEKLDSNLERIFRLLALRYGPSDIYSAYLGIISGRKELRASAIEFLDNVLGKNLKKYLIPILDQVSIEVTVRKGQDLFQLEIKDLDHGLECLIRGDDPWLKSCALFALGESPRENLLDLAEEARKDPDPIVRETAGYAIARVRG
ncbi:MAG: hypothetical protein GTO42_02340 [Candidatus Latescibacteria bacterium]|nr:hypothetical protein [Candidatus Latescibacterota bacterium]NIO00975.1 hypothetical protein [Candidatus Latescibacterota bacterium]NIO27374.1 hypothetical protein [Candidatus Latescibacterota bacterium]NIO54896.1 hypothetical protein [Candidatus Latescibacterota bacterium]NIT00985.1 hypothetical protein [Candidatus Latescibacterota bacterium]